MLLQKQFSPPFFLKNRHIQSMLASVRFRAPKDSHPVFANAAESILETSGGARLQAFYSPLKDAKGLVFLIHGWEGSAGSTYVKSAAAFLYDRGYEIFRPNLRDHGNTHHLNTGLFFGTLFEEVYEAAVRAADLAGDRPFFIAGCSLGGNYALRLARESSSRPIANLSRVVAVSPVLDPAKATRAVDETFFYRLYFLRKWKRSLARKQQVFPEIYDFSRAMRKNTIYGVTEALLPEYSPYATAEQYFRGYTLTRDALLHIPVPAL
ncbi:MAG: YheT family hydrolase, partial [Desulfosalsimonas sp.]